jgi:DNA-binding PadR family transcriptional regulator
MKYFFLSLLSRQPTHGYDLLRTYESLFSTVMPSLNAGQIYTTLSRLERDGLVHKFVVEQEGKPNKQVYELTEQGRQVLLAWFGEPLTGPRIKDSFYLKLMSARMTDFANPHQIIEEQRGHYLQTLHDLNALALQPEMADDPTRLLLIQGAILHLRADLEWLDLCEDHFLQE